MKALIVYFSQTGNTRQVAAGVAEGFEEGGCESVEVLPLGRAGDADWQQCDAFALGAPVFYYKEPANVRAWIRSLGRRGGPVPCFTFITHGGNPTNTLRRMQKQLAAKGGRVVRSYACLGYDTYPIYLKSFRAWGHPDHEELAGAKRFGIEAFQDAAQMMAGEPVAPARYDFVGGKTFRLSIFCREPLMKFIFPGFHVDEGLCTKCGACARACPTENIRLDPYPEYLDRCIWCYLCERVCPHGAIQCDWTKLRKRMGEG